jgi:hypothetical protein
MSPEQSAFASVQLVDSEIVPLYGPNELAHGGGRGVICLSVIFGASVRWHSEGDIQYRLRKLPAVFRDLLHWQLSTSVLLLAITGSTVLK